MDENWQYRNTDRRILVGLIDGVLILGALALTNNTLLDTDSRIQISLVIIFQNIFVLSYGILLHGYYGQTLGKYINGIKVIDLSEEKNISLRQAIYRDAFFVAIIAISIPFCTYINMTGAKTPITRAVLDVLDDAGLVWFLTEIITCCFNSKRRALHDYIAGTVVVKTEYLASLPIKKSA